MYKNTGEINQRFINHVSDCLVYYKSDGISIESLQKTRISIESLQKVSSIRMAIGTASDILLSRKSEADDEIKPLKDLDTDTMYANLFNVVNENTCLHLHMFLRRALLSKFGNSEGTNIIKKSGFDWILFNEHTVSITHLYRYSYFIFP